MVLFRTQNEQYKIEAKGTEDRGDERDGTFPRKIERTTQGMW